MLNKFESDEREQELQDLAEANQELVEENNRLKRQVGDMLAARQPKPAGDGDQSLDNDQDSEANNAGMTNEVHAEIVMELNEQLDELKHEVEQARLAKQDLVASEAVYKKEIQGLKYDNKRTNMDLKDAKERFEKVKQEY